MCAVAGFAGQTMPVQSVPTNDVIPNHIGGRVVIGDVEIAANVDRAGVGNGPGAGAIQGPERRPIRSVPSGKAVGGDAAGVCETPERVKICPERSQRVHWTGIRRSSEPRAQCRPHTAIPTGDVERRYVASHGCEPAADIQVAPYELQRDNRAAGESTAGSRHTLAERRPPVAVPTGEIVDRNRAGVREGAPPA